MGINVAFVKTVLKDRKTCKSCGICDFNKIGQYPRFAGGNLNAKIVLLFQNPNYKDPNGRNYDYPRETRDTITSQELIKAVNERLLEYWVKRKHKKFFSFLKDQGISFNEDNMTMSDFYFTDVVKCPAKTKELDKVMKGKGNPIDACKEILKEELKKVKPKLILCFGKRSAHALTKIYGIDGFKPKRFSSDVTKKHGNVYKITSLKCYVLPLVHPQVEYLTIKNTYYNYLKKGLKKVKEKLKINSFKELN